MVDDKRHETNGIYPFLDQLTDHLKSVGYLSNNSVSFSDLGGQLSIDVLLYMLIVYEEGEV